MKRYARTNDDRIIELKDKTENLYFIFSNKHEQWWQKDFCDYCDDINKAGVYTFDEVKNRYGDRIANFDEDSEDSYLVPFDEIMSADIIKTSDNIEDLFDLIVLAETYDNEKYHIILYKDKLEYYKRFECFGGKTKTKEGIEYQLYGSIWTDSELRFVAKLDSDGNFKLI